MDKTIVKALGNLCIPGTWGIVGDNYEDIIWHGNPENKPTKQQVLEEIEKINKTEYQRKRIAEYPSIGDQLDALFHAGVFPSDMADKIQAVKDKYPKV